MDQKRNWRAPIFVLVYLLSLNFRNTFSLLTLSPNDFENKAQQILQRHNLYRQCHLAPPLIIDNELNVQAQTLANMLANNEIYLNEARNEYPVNVFVTQTLNLNPVDKWYEEIRNYKDRATINTDHFTQLIWKGSKKLGVGIAQGDDGAIYVVCKYDPAGNLRNLYNENVSLVPDVPSNANVAEICRRLNLLNSIDSWSQSVTSSSSYGTNVTSSEMANDILATTTSTPKPTTNGVFFARNDSATTNADMDNIMSGNTTETITGDATKNRSELFIKLLFILMNVLLITMAVVVVVLTMYLIIKIFVCCRNKRSGREQASATVNPTVPSTQPPPTLSCVTPMGQTAASPPLPRSRSPPFHSSLSRLY